jgi:hypothetical protein
LLGGEIPDVMGVETRAPRRLRALRTAHQRTARRSVHGLLRLNPQPFADVLQFG